MAGRLIGLTAYCEHAHWASWRAPAVLLPASYGNQVLAAGGVPVLLPPVPGIADAVRRLDGLILTGGGDMDPARYGETPHPRTARISAAEMYRTFNCGIGMVAIVPAQHSDTAINLLNSGGENACVIGEVRRGAHGVVINE